MLSVGTYCVAGARILKYLEYFFVPGCAISVMVVVLVVLVVLAVFGFGGLVGGEIRCF